MTNQIFGGIKMKIYKIYNEENNESLFARSLTELKALIEIRDDQIKKLFCKGIVTFNGLTVISY